MFSPVVRCFFVEARDGGINDGISRNGHETVCCRPRWVESRLRDGVYNNSSIKDARARNMPDYAEIRVF